jgi:hypothetical protein
MAKLRYLEDLRGAKGLPIAEVVMGWKPPAGKRKPPVGKRKRRT